MELAINSMSFLFQKKWAIRFAVVAIFIICTISLASFNLYRPLHTRIISGLVNSFLLNFPLFISAMRIPSGKFRYLLALGVLTSGLTGLLLVIRQGWPLGIMSLVFHFWLIYELLSQKVRK
jgi:hypothetical protein